MNPLYTQLANNDEHDYNEARRKLLEAMDSFEKLKPEQKKQLINEVCRLKTGMDLLSYIAQRR